MGSESEFSASWVASAAAPAVCPRSKKSDGEMHAFCLAPQPAIVRDDVFRHCRLIPLSFYLFSQQNHSDQYLYTCR